MHVDKHIAMAVRVAAMAQLPEKPARALIFMLHGKLNNAKLESWMKVTPF
jgi:hypothetical protein